MIDSAWAGSEDLVRLIEAREAARADLNGCVERVRAQRGQVAWWEAPSAAATVESTPDALGVELGRAQRRLEEACQAVDMALGVAARSAPPLRLVCMNDRAIGLVRAWTGQLGEQSQAISTQLEAIADFVASTWLPGVDLRAVLERLGREDLDALPPPPPLRTTPSWGYSPLHAEELFARVGHALARSNLPALRRELALQQQSAKGHEGRGLLERVADNVFGVSEDDAPGVDARSLIGATENVHYALMEGLGVYPPLRVWLVAVGAAELTDPCFAVVEPTIDRTTGAVVVSAAHLHRALLVRAISAVARAIDEVFPELREVSIALRSGQARSRREPGPYRAAARHDEDHEERSLASDPRAQLADALSTMGAIERLDRSIAHGLMVHELDAVIEGARARSAGARFGLWVESPSDDGGVNPTARRKWHADFVRGLFYEACALVTGLQARMPALALRDAVLTLNEKARPIAIVQAGEVGLRHATAGVTDSLRAFDAMASILQNLLGGAFDRVRLMRDVARVLTDSHAARAAHPFATHLAAELASTPFVTLFARLSAHQSAFELAAKDLAGADSALSFWDRLNPLGDSPAKTAARLAQLQVEGLPQAIQADWSATCAIFDPALRRLPKAALGVALYDARDALRRVRFEVEAVRVHNPLDRESEKVTVYTAHGAVDATMAIHRWTQQAMAVFGPMCSSGELLFIAASHLLSAPRRS